MRSCCEALYYPDGVCVLSKSQETLWLLVVKYKLLDDIRLMLAVVVEITQQQMNSYGFYDLVLVTVALIQGIDYCVCDVCNLFSNLTIVSGKNRILKDI